MPNNVPYKTLQRLVAGQPTQIDAASYNAMAKYCESPDGVQNYELRGREDSVIVLCKNSTGAEIPAFTMVSLETPVLPSEYSGLTKLYNATMTLSAIPTEDDVVGVTQEEIKNGESGYVMISGITPVAFTSSPSDKKYATPDGTGGQFFTDDYGTCRILYALSGANYAICLIGTSSSAGGATGDYYQGYFKLSSVEKVRQIENPDYNPEDPDSPQYIAEIYYEAHHSGGRYTVNGQVGSMLGGDVAGDLTDNLQDVILHFHSNAGIEDQTPTGVSVELSPLLSNSLNDSYWLLGQASLSEVIQQSHGVPSLLWFGCREQEQSVSEGGAV